MIRSAIKAIVTIIKGARVALNVPCVRAAVSLRQHACSEPVRVRERSAAGADALYPSHRGCFAGALVSAERPPISD
jgi:hypothetical protein